MKVSLAIAVFISIIFIRNLSFWSPFRTYFFGDTAIYSLHLATLAGNLRTLFDPKESILLWDPTFLSVGLPSLSIVDIGFLYPPNLIIAALAHLFGNPMLVFPFYNLSILLHLGFGAFFIYKILKEFWHLDDFPSLAGSLLWLFAGFNLEFIGASAIMLPGTYLPFCFYLVLKNPAGKINRYFFAFYGSLALSFLVGYPMVSLIVAALSLASRFFLNFNYKAKTELLRVIAAEAGGLLFITLPIILPLYLTAFSNLERSVRAPLKLDAFLQNPAPALNLVEPLLPKNTLFNTLGSVNLVYLYFSLVALIVIFQSKVKFPDLITERKNQLLFLAGLLGLLLALGGVTTIPSLMFYLVPGINVFRRLSVFSLLPAFSFALLAPQFIKPALGNRSFSKVSLFWVGSLALLALYSQVVSLLNSTEKDVAPSVTYLYQSLFLSISLTVLTLIALFSHGSHPRFAKVFLILTLLTEGGTVSASKFYLNSKTDPAQIFTPNRVIKSLKDQLVPSERTDLLASQYSYNSDYLGIEQTLGYLSLASTYGAEINDAFNRANYRKENLLNLLGIKYLVKKGAAEETGLEKIKEFKQDLKQPDFFAFDYASLNWQPEVSGTTYSLYRNPTALPRVFLAAALKTSEPSKEIISEIAASPDPKTLFIDERDFKGSVDGVGEARLLEYQRNYLKIETKTTAPQFLAATIAFYPGWKIKINGRETKPIQTDWFMIGTYLPEGKNLVELTYSPKELSLSLYYGFFSILTWLFFLGWRTINQKS